MKNIVVLANALLCLIISCPLFATPILLDNFYADETVSLSSDRFSAVIEESAIFPSTLLSNDPFLGDPEIIIASIDSVLEMDVEFIEAASEDDEFRITLFDSSDFTLLDEYFSDTNMNEVISFDLSDYIGKTLGLQFELRSFDTSFNSIVNIHGVSLSRIESVEIPEPTTLFLCFSILALMLPRITKN